MNIGELDKRIKIEQATETRSGTGAVIKSWATFLTAWAGIDPPKGREFFAAGQIQAEVTVRVRIRYRAGVTPQMRVLFGTRVFDINSVIDPDEAHVELILMCTEVLD